MLREPRFFIGLPGAAGTLAGAIVTLAVAKTPLSVEARVAFWLLITLFVVFLIYLTFPLLEPLLGRLSSALQRHRTRLRAKREFPEWARAWFKLTQIIRQAAMDGLPINTERRAQYAELRQALQRLSPGFLRDLEQRVRDNVLDAIDTGSFLGPPDIHQEVANADHPFRLFYAEPNLQRLVRCLRPNMYSQAAFSVDKDLEDLESVLDRLWDIIREFGAEIGVNVDRIVRTSHGNNKPVRSLNV